MDVWIVNPFDNLPGEGFRSGRYALLAHALLAAGHRVTWWTSDFNHALKRRRAVPAAPAEGLVLRLLPTRPYVGNISLARVRSHRALARTWSDAVRGEPPPDMIVASVPPLALADAVRRYAAVRNVPFVADIQDAWPETFYRLLPRAFRFAAPVLFAPLRATARRVYRAAARVTGVCDGYAALASAAGARDYRRFYLGAEFASVAASAPRPCRARRLVYAGGLGFSYDLRTVLAAVARLPDVTLDVAGCAAPHRDGRVTYHGYLDSVALASLLASCDVGLVPMSDDSRVGIPNKVADYAAAGLPVLSSLAGECAALLARTGSGVSYAPGDVDGFCRALRSMTSVVYDLADLRRALDARTVYSDFVRCLEETRSGMNVV